MMVRAPRAVDLLTKSVDDRLRWGRIETVTTIEDTQRLAMALERLVAAGVAEATAPPIEDAPQTFEVGEMPRAARVSSVASEQGAST